MRSATLAAPWICVWLALGMCGCEMGGGMTAEPGPNVAQQPGGHFDRALDCEAQQNYAAAADQYCLAVQEDPKDSRALVNLGLLHACNGRPKHAEVCWQQAVKVNPEDVRAHNLLGGAYMRQKRYSEAVEQYEKALQTSPKSASVHWNIAAAYRNLRRRDEAAEHYRKYVEFASPGEKEDLLEARQYLTAVGDQ